MPDLNRRDFAEAIALEAIALAGLAPLLRVVPKPMRLPALAPVAVVEDLSPLAKALAGAIRAQYADRLSEGDLATISQQIETSLERAAKVRQVALSNGDEPDFVFSAVVAGSPG